MDHGHGYNMINLIQMSIGGLRVAGLAFKLALTLFLARYLPTTELGVYGLVVAASSILPGVFGFGLSYFTNREIVDSEYSGALVVARDRMIISAAVFLLLAVVLVCCYYWIDDYLLSNVPFWLMVLFFEFVGFDINLILISRGRAALASLIFFIRTAVWVPFFIGLAYFLPSLRNLDSLVYAWFSGGFISIVLVLTCYSKALTRAVLLSPFESKRYIGLAFKARWVWFSDIALALGQNVDRVIIGALMGPAAAGVYYFYFVTTLSTFQIVQAAVIQPSIPVIRRAFIGGGDAHYSLIRGKMVSALMYTTILTLAGQLAIYIIVIYTGKQDIISYLMLSPLFALGAFSKTIAEFLGIVDYATEQDRRYIFVNLVALVLTVLGVSLLTNLIGLFGSVMGFNIAMITVMLLRLYFYRWVWAV